jgi:hypothetical protein
MGINYSTIHDYQYVNSHTNSCELQTDRQTDGWPLHRHAVVHSIALGTSLADYNPLRVATSRCPRKGFMLPDAKRLKKDPR